MTSRSPVLIATLGSEPQVVTLALDDLFRQGVEIRHVTVLHTDPAQPRIGEALDTVKAELPRAYGDRLSLKLVPICLHDTPIADVTTPEEARAVLRAIYVTVSDLKQAGATVHLCAAGGRKAMSMYAMLVAQLLFGAEDHLWLLVSTDTLLKERRLHASEHEASLVRVPVLPWEFNLTEKRAFVEGQLTRTEVEVLEQAARYGLTDAQIATQRGVAVNTVETHMSRVFDKVRASWGRERVDRRTLIREFGVYFEIMEALRQE